MSRLSHHTPSPPLLSQLAVGDAALAARLERDLRLTAEALRRYVTDAAPADVAEVVLYLFADAAKRLRPLLVLLGAEFGTDRPGADRSGAEAPTAGRRDIIDAAVVAEMIHVASLYHDDVIDQATTRRGSASANARWGNANAVRAGNWLLAKAAWISAGLGLTAVSLHAEAAEALVSGQLVELLGPEEDAASISHYLTVAAGKSATLISTSLRLGAILAGAPEAAVAAVGDYGTHLGIAFQISDDLLDVTGDPTRLGKEPGKDLALGVASLPILLALADRGPSAEEFRALLGQPSLRRHALTLLRRSDAMDAARTMLEERLVRARSALAALPRSPSRTVLDALCDVVARRDH
ncbi:polyprenyl synthetase family protein [Streptomyces sp. SBT349]|uniref:polyprenyl synthetase family protein n=1 Tax=Streptomyces sp. SBT349 TaxID=1580539 RepID=UPI00066DE85D|nr:polyprenyl synthetase family protein [Streptomyces sp. SBT349]